MLVWMFNLEDGKELLLVTVTGFAHQSQKREMPQDTPGRGKGRLGLDAALEDTE
jgi:hypothetical protein